MTYLPRMSQPPRVKLTSATSNKIRKSRQKLGISQAELARAAELPRARVKRIECLEIETVCQFELAKIQQVLKSKTERAKAPANVSSGRGTRAKTARKLLEKHGLLDVTLGELLRS